MTIKLINFAFLFLTSLVSAHAGEHVYLAGPLFTEGERMEMENLANLLESQGFKTFLPHRDGLEFDSIFPYLIHTLNISPDLVAKQMHYAIDALDVYQVAVGNDAIVMNINGRTPDEGAVAELAIAWALGKPGVIFRMDSRALSNGRNNPLVMGRADFVEANDLQEVPVLLRSQIHEYSEQGASASRHLPPKVVEKVAQGEKIWNLLKELRRENASVAVRNARVANLIEKLFPPCELILK